MISLSATILVSKVEADIPPILTTSSLVSVRISSMASIAIVLSLKVTSINSLFPFLYCFVTSLGNIS